MADATDRFRDVAPEVRRYFDAKGLKPSWSWRDVAPREHAHAFTVARSAGFDILADVRDAVGKAIRERQDFDAFRNDLEPILKAKGWWGPSVDPVTGEKVQLGSIRRLKTIYWANIRTAYAAGEWEKIEAAKRALPYLIYVISTAARKREEHLAWVGVILPVDHEWWNEHYPPNGWGCMCRVRQISDFEAESLGYDPNNPAAPPDFGTRTYKSRRSGREITAPVGVDPAWAQNPGKARAQQAADMIAGRLDAAPPEARRIAAADLADSWLARMIRDGGFEYVDDASLAMKQLGAIASPVAVIPETMARAIGAETHVVRFSVSSAAKQAVNRQSKKGVPQITPEDYVNVQRLIDEGTAVVQKRHDIVIVGILDGKWWHAALRRAETVATELYLSSFRRTDKESAAKVISQGGVIGRE